MLFDLLLHSTELGIIFFTFFRRFLYYFLSLFYSFFWRNRFLLINFKFFLQIIYHLFITRNIVRTYVRTYKIAFRLPSILTIVIINPFHQVIFGSILNLNPEQLLNIIESFFWIRLRRNLLRNKLILFLSFFIFHIIINLFILFWHIESY